MARNRIRVASVCLLLLLAGAPAAATESLELSAVLAATRIEPPATVAFSESRHNPLFEEPLELEGYVEYLAPGVMRKVIESPFKETLTIDSGKVSVEAGGETRQLPGRSGKALATLLAPIEAILAGDEQPLTESFDYAVGGGEADWHIELRPRARRLRKHVTGVRVSGSLSSVNEIRTDLEGGEQHIMRLHHDDAPPQ